MPKKFPHVDAVAILAMDLDDPFGGGGEPGGEDDLFDGAAAVGASEEILGEETPTGPSRVDEAAQTPVALAPPVAPPSVLVLLLSSLRVPSALPLTTRYGPAHCESASGRIVVSRV